MGAYDDVLAGCFSTDVKAVVVVVVVATTARQSTTKRRVVNVNMRRFKGDRFNGLLVRTTYYTKRDFHTAPPQH
jgi:hypothetical protein